MKLAAQYTRASMLVTVVVLLIAAGVYYFAISYITDQQFDRDLTEELGEMSQFIQQHQRFPKPFEFDGYQAKFTRIGKYEDARFVDTLVTGPNKTETGRAIISTVQLNHQNYRMTIVASKDATENLVQLITLITAVLTLVLLTALFLTNRFLLQGLWRPFYALLNRLESFSLNGKGTSPKQLTRVDEFLQLQTAIETMEQKAATEYQTLKTFTENASHEMMTPVAVITSKLDNLIQDERLDEHQLNELQDIYNAGTRLSRLGQSLLLLVKIDHQLISDITVIHLDELLKEQTGQFSEIIVQKHISLTTDLQPVQIEASYYLVDILLNNLLSNAIRHNNSNGLIHLSLNAQQLLIANIGPAEGLDAHKIFERFQKSPASDGTGLGLTIARNICAGYGWQLEYHFDDGRHIFAIRF